WFLNGVGGYGSINDRGFGDEGDDWGDVDAGGSRADGGGGCGMAGGGGGGVEGGGGSGGGVGGGGGRRGMGGGGGGDVAGGWGEGEAAVGGLTGWGMEVIDMEVVTTPGVAMMVKHLNAEGGVIVTASHNPIEWNGLKFLNRDAVAPPPSDAAAIRKIYDEER